MVKLGEYMKFERLMSGLGIKEVVEMKGGLKEGKKRNEIEVKDGRYLMKII